MFLWSVFLKTHKKGIDRQKHHFGCFRRFKTDFFVHFQKYFNSFNSKKLYLVIMTMLHGYMQTYSSLFSDTKKPQSLSQKQKKKIEDDDIHTDRFEHNMGDIIPLWT